MKNPDSIITFDGKAGHGISHYVTIEEKDNYGFISLTRLESLEWVLISTIVANVKEASPKKLREVLRYSLNSYFEEEEPETPICNFQHTRLAKSLDDTFDYAPTLLNYLDYIVRKTAAEAQFEEEDDNDATT